MKSRVAKQGKFQVFRSAGPKSSSQRWYDGRQVRARRTGEYRGESGSADVNQELTFPEKDQALRDDVRTLGAMLGHVLKEQESQEFFELVERVRVFARDHRRGQDSAGESLEAQLQDLNAGEALELIRAFSAYFFLVNMAERVHRIRRRIDYLSQGSPQAGSWQAVFEKLYEQGLSFEDVQDLFESFLIQPVFTAHPTEAIRRTLLVKEQRIARALVDIIEMKPVLKRDLDAIAARIRNDVVAAWQTEEHLRQKPSVADEVEHLLFYLSDVIYRVIPRYYEDVEHALTQVFGESARDALPNALPNAMVRFGSWVGGDMDGNPNVGPRTIRQTLARQKELIVKKYRDEVRKLFDFLSQSSSRVSVSKKLDARNRSYRRRMLSVYEDIPARYHDMPYRVLLWFISARLDQTLNRGDLGYENPQAFVEDLRLILDSLKQNKGETAGAFLVKRLLRRVETFGFHLATLDIRQDALVHRHVIGQLLGVSDFVSQSREQRLVVLEKALEADDEVSGEFDEETEEALEVMTVLSQVRESFGPEAIGPYIISMAQGPDDALAVLALARGAGFRTAEGDVPLDIAPLFETVDDLESARATMEALVKHPIYRAHLKARGGQQVIMIGYSDSNKESGLVASRWALHKAQLELVGWAREHGLELILFHGRGGTVSRGGTKTRNGILAAPAGAVAGHLRITEQGEIVHAKYGLRGIAIRTLELMSAAVLEQTALSGSQEETARIYDAVMNEWALASRQTFRALVYEDPDFYQYFREATPIDVIERLRIGSRPASRRAQKGIGDLRAIPWVFSWTQSRHILPGWYGVGMGLTIVKNTYGIDLLREMNEKFPMFTNIISDVEMVLAKADMDMAARYAKLSPSVGPAVFGKVMEEFERTKTLILEVQGTTQLLEREPMLQRAIRLRNPYIDPMSLLQIDLLKRWRAGDRQDKDLEEALFSSVQGIARGLLNTG